MKWRSQTKVAAIAVLAAAGLVVPSQAFGAAPSGSADGAGSAASQSQFASRLTGPDLARWQALSSTQRAHVMSVLNDSRLVPNLTDAQLKAISPDLSVSEVTKTEPVPSSGPAASAYPAALAAAAATYEVHSSYYKDYKVLGISYTRVGLDYYYVTGSGVVLSDHYCSASYTNYVPMRTAASQVNHYVSGGQGYCIVTWTLTKVGFWTTTSDQGMIVNGPGIVSTWGP